MIMPLYLTLYLFYTQLQLTHIRCMMMDDKSKCFEVNIRPFRMPPVSNRCTLTPSIRQYIICSCTTSIDEAMPPSLVLLRAEKRPSSC